MQKLHSLTVIASVAVSPWRFVDSGGGHAANAAAAIGISEQPAQVGRAFSAVTGYSCWVEAAAAIAERDLVKPATDGTGRAAKGTSGDSCGRALSTAAAGKLVLVRFLEAAPAVSGGGNVTVTNRDGMGRVTNYTEGGVTYVVTYGPYGIATISGGGQITTYSYDASGLLTGTVTV